MRKGKKMEMVLFALVGGALITAELLDMMFPRRYGKTPLAPPSYQNEERQKFYALLNYLKKQGFIENKKKGRSALWKITVAGLKKLQFLNKLNMPDYKAETDDKFKIIIFDIPEKERKKRMWLREVLKRLGFKMLQLSVWIGKNKIPEQFLLDLKEKQILAYVHILEIGKSGTLKTLN